jgi:hypothetical protein
MVGGRTLRGGFVRLSCANAAIRRLVVRRVDVGRVEPADALAQHLSETASRIGGDGISTQSCSVMGFLVTRSAADEFVAPGQSMVVTP